jgi:protein SCO1
MLVVPGATAGDDAASRRSCWRLASRWLFVTGERNALHRLISDGFHLAVAERSPSANTDGDGLITHGDPFVLADRDLQIRGYYHGTEEESVQQLLKDVQMLQGGS